MEAKDLELRMVRETHSILLSSKKKVVGGAYSCVSLPFDCFKLTASSQKSLVQWARALTRPKPGAK